MVVDFRKKNADPATPLTLCDSPVNTVESFRFLGSIITQDLKRELNISTFIKKAQPDVLCICINHVCITATAAVPVTGDNVFENTFYLKCN